ncbi:MAG: protein kinase domain-containing protein [Myxococcota bacterium]
MRLGRYQLLSRLSVGGMAEIFLATTENRGLVTIKRILPDLRDFDEFVRMFVDESRISASLSHPNIAQVYELGQEGGELFIAMEFISGQSLSSILRTCQKMKRPFPIGVAAMVGRDLCKALQHAHELTLQSGEPSPIIHRDISPNNVMLTYEGKVKVIDFGVAKAKGSLSRTSTGNIKGSHGYMSPEQARGAPLDPRSDLFSAGVVLHELLTGRPLFKRGSELLTFRGILRDEIPAPIAANPGVPRALSDVVMTALHRNPEARFPNAAAMARAISAAVPSLMATEEDVAAFLRGLFKDQMDHAQALLASASSGLTAMQTAAAKLSGALLPAPTAVTAHYAAPVSGHTEVYGPLPTGVIRLSEVAPPPEPEPAPSAEPSVEGASVLSVDDSEISREFIGAHLESSGFPVLHCASAREALALIENRLPDLVLLDIHMPGVNGLELCRTLRERCTQRPFLPILFLSSSTSFDERLEGLAAGGDDFIRKPYHPDELVGLVRAHLRRAAFLEQQNLKARAERRRATKPVA